MNNTKDLHTHRLQKALDQIEDFRKQNITAHNEKFEDWKERVKQSLGVLFGKDHDYTKRFAWLSFWELRADIGHGLNWTWQDQETFEKDLAKAKRLLSDALEELPLVPNPQVGGTPTSTSLQRQQPPIIINVQNVLSQTTKVEILQLFSDLESLGLSAEKLKEAKKSTEELAAEARGQQRWTILAKSLEALKSIGKNVYERVAIPLLLEMLKKQIGIP
jgi:hypothetical protein